MVKTFWGNPLLVSHIREESSHLSCKPLVSKPHAMLYYLVTVVALCTKHLLTARCCVHVTLFDPLPSGRHHLNVTAT